MSETTRKMIGLALMAISVFAVLFGLHVPDGASAAAGAILSWAGVVAFFLGLVLYAVER